MLHSKLVRKLRRERNLSQEELARGISQRSTLSSFERQGTRLSFELLHAYLARMNVTLEEYEFLFRGQKLTQQQEVSVLLASKLSEPYDAMFAKELLTMYQKTDTFYYYSLYAQYCAVRHFRKDNLAKTEMNRITKTVKSYLDGIQTWGRFELRLFTNCLCLFSDAYIQFQFVEAVHYMRMYKDSMIYMDDLQRFIITGLTVAYQRKAEKSCRLFLNELKKLAGEQGAVEAKLVHKIFCLLLDHNRGVENTKEKVELLFALEVLEETEWLAFVETHYC